jgi:hypothetical protein
MLTTTEKLRKYAKRTLNRIVHRPGKAVPVLLFGEMRSGTNMLLDCFDSTLRAETYNETDDEAFEAYELRDLSHLRKLVDRSPGSHVVFKPTADGNRAGAIMDGLPGGRGVWIFRSYLDAINSALKSFKQHHEYLERIVQRSPNARWRAINMSEADIEMIGYHLDRGLSDASARGLIWCIRNEFYFRQGLDRRSDVLLVNYEDLVLKPVSKVREVFEFVGLLFHPKYVREVSAESIGRAAPPDLDPEIRIMCDELLRRLKASCEVQRACRASTTPEFLDVDSVARSNGFDG